MGGTDCSFPYPIKPLSYFCPVACGCHCAFSEIRTISHARPPRIVARERLTGGVPRFALFANSGDANCLTRALVETRPHPSMAYGL
jgi:hypothetical protein|eukprot:2636588-Prymnesium_polylepis.1